jgi:hypothetical protein
MIVLVEIQLPVVMVIYVKEIIVHVQVKMQINIIVEVFQILLTMDVVGKWRLLLHVRVIGTKHLGILDLLVHENVIKVAVGEVIVVGNGNIIIVKISIIHV